MANRWRRWLYSSSSAKAPSSALRSCNSGPRSAASATVSFRWSWCRDWLTSSATWKAPSALRAHPRRCRLGPSTGISCWHQPPASCWLLRRCSCKREPLHRRTRFTTPRERLEKIRRFLAASVRPPIMRTLLAPDGNLGALKHFGQPGNDLTAKGADACLVVLADAVWQYHRLDKPTALTDAEGRESSILLLRALRDIAAIFSTSKLRGSDRSRVWCQAQRRGVAPVCASSHSVVLWLQPTLTVLNVGHHESRRLRAGLTRLEYAPG